MPCPDSSSSITLKLDSQERFLSFEFAKITCGRSIDAATGYQRYCGKKTLREIRDIPYAQAAYDLNAVEEERRFVLYLEWDALRCAVAQYLGHVNDPIDQERCHICSINHHDEGVEVDMIILPPKEMPNILPCSSSDHQTE
jgi:hypothetical protein